MSSFRTKRRKYVVTQTLHIFMDAPHDAYGAVVYSRLIYKSGLVSMRIVLARSRVAPLAAMSVSWLEFSDWEWQKQFQESWASTWIKQSFGRIVWMCCAGLEEGVDGSSLLLRIMLERYKMWQTLNNGDTSQPTRIQQMYSWGEWNYQNWSSTTKWWDGPDFLGKEEANWPINNWK